MTTPGFPNFDDIIGAQDWNSLGQQFFMDQPDFGFEGALGESNQPRGAVDLFRRRAGHFMSQYNQNLSKMLLSGQAPTLNPYKFFSGHGGPEHPFNFRDEFLKTSPLDRGQFSSRFSPSARWLVAGR